MLLPQYYQSEKRRQDLSDLIALYEQQIHSASQTKSVDMFAFTNQLYAKESSKVYEPEPVPLPVSTYDITYYEEVPAFPVDVVQDYREELISYPYLITSTQVKRFFSRLCMLRLLSNFCVQIITDYILVQHTAIVFPPSLMLDGDIEPNPGPQTANQRKRGNRPKQKTKKQMKNKQAKQDETKMVLRPPPPVQSVQQISEVANLTFQLGSTVFNNPGGNIIVEPFYTNDGYDILPSILTPAMQFINYKFTLYKYCKVINVRFILTFDNLEQAPIDLYFFTSAQNLASNFATRAAVNAQAATKKLLWTDVMSEQYGKKSQITMDKLVLPWATLGNKREYFSSNDFSFTQSSNPARITYAAWVACSPFSIIPTGVVVRTSLNFKLLFYDPLDLTSPQLNESSTDRPLSVNKDRGKFVKR